VTWPDLIAGLSGLFKIPSYTDRNIRKGYLSTVP